MVIPEELCGTNKPPNYMIYKDNRMVMPIPSHITHLTLETQSRLFLQGFLPPTLTHLTINNYNHEQLLAEDMLPESLTHFTMYSFTQPITAGLFPRNLVNLAIHTGFNFPVAPGVLPDGGSLTHVNLGFDFDSPLVPGSIPLSVTHLDIGAYRSQPLLPGQLPVSLTHLTFSPTNQYEHPLVPGSLPDNIQHLSFGIDYNLPLQPNVLPASLTHVTFGACFNQPLRPGCLPLSLTHIAFGYNFHGIIHPGSLPPSLQLIRSTGIYTRDIPKDVLPQSLKYLDVGRSFPASPLPSSLTHLSMLYIRDITRGMLPPTLTHLEMDNQISSINIAKGSLPPSLCRLTVLTSDNVPMVIVFHNSWIPHTISHIARTPSTGRYVGPFGESLCDVDLAFVSNLLSNPHISIITGYTTGRACRYIQYRRIDNKTMLRIPLYKYADVHY
eukprot:gene7924-9309_t